MRPIPPSWLLFPHLPTSRSSIQHRQHLTTTPTSHRPILQSTRYTPTLKPSAVTQDATLLPSVKLLIRGGFIRQSSAGVWTLLPNGVRVLEKLEKIVDEEMAKLGATKVQLPTLQPASLWELSNRYTTSGKELMRLTDRKDAPFILAPTHEEEVTQLVAQDIKSSKQLPVRVYQIGRKFRDELRPRAGLLRAKEFIMKDLYTFDATKEEAVKTYYEVREAYDKIFERIGVPFMAAEADSGNIGGELSHEYQFGSPSGEDTVIKCPSCQYTSNLELAICAPFSSPRLQALPYTLPTSSLLHALILPASTAPNHIKLQRLLPTATPFPLGEGKTELDQWEGLRVVVDRSVAGEEESEIWEAVEELLESLAGGSGLVTTPMSVWPTPPAYSIADVLQVTGTNGEACHHCRTPLEPHKAIEVGHTFYLGTKYSTALQAGYQSSSGEWTPFEMGCYGIGVSRLLGAVAECTSRPDGLRWPASVAPYKVCIVATSAPKTLTFAKSLGAQLEGLPPVGEGEVLVDDREERVGWKLKDAEVCGWPVVVVVGRKWEEEGVVEVRSAEGEVVVKPDEIGDTIARVLGVEEWK